MGGWVGGERPGGGPGGNGKVLAGLDGPRPESVTARRGAGGFTRLMMGSVAGQVAQHAHCPVLIVPPEYRS